MKLCTKVFVMRDILYQPKTKKPLLLTSNGIIYDWHLIVDFALSIIMSNPIFKPVRFLLFVV